MIKAHFLCIITRYYNNTSSITQRIVSADVDEDLYYNNTELIEYIRNEIKGELDSYDTINGIYEVTRKL